jgi:hypothetical protein
MWGIVWLCHLDSLSLYRQCGRDVGLREQHPLECRLLDALVVESSTTPLYIIKGLINNYVRPPCRIRYYSYLCYMIFIYITLISAILILGGSILILKCSPSSKVSSFIRRHLITDEDLEPLD